MKKKTIYYWSPFLTEIATCKAVINSAYGIQKYFNNYQTIIIDAIGEFKQKKSEIKEKNIDLISFNNLDLIKYLPKHGKFNSRLSFIIIFLISFLKLKELLKKNKPDYLVIHLITILPLILFFFFKFDTKCILRISGFPIMTPFRKWLWKILFKNVYLITCPTKNTLLYIKSLKLVEENKLRLLYDPAISMIEILKKKNENVHNCNDNFIAVGRLTNQKNFEFLIKNFKYLNRKENKYFLNIFGDGEKKKILEKLIVDLNLPDVVKLNSFVENIFPYINKSRCLILSSFWEDPGFVLLEAAACRTFIISSDCNNGPTEIIENDKAGLLFKTNSSEDFIRVFSNYLKLSEIEINVIKKNALKKAKCFTIFNHAKNFMKILNNQ